MKIVIKALTISCVIHLIYILGMLSFGYMQTKNYKPEIENTWDNVVVLQDEVAFGFVGFPFTLLYSFIGIALISGLISLYSKVKKDASPKTG